MGWRGGRWGMAGAGRPGGGGGGRGGVGGGETFQEGPCSRPEREAGGEQGSGLGEARL